MTRGSCLATCLLVVLSLAAAACGGGGGSAASGPDVLELGLVSGSGPSRKTVTLVNPRDAAATVAVASNTPRLRFDAATLPASAVPPGGQITCDVVVTPTGPGGIDDEIALLWSLSATDALGVAYRVRCTVEQVVVVATPAVLDFGTPAFGGQAERTFELHNQSAVSTVTYTSASLPPDARVVSPVLPFPVAPGERVAVTIRWSPWTSMETRDTTASLNSAWTSGSASFRVRAQPAPATVTVDFGIRQMVDGLSELFSVDVPATVWSLQVEAWIDGALVPEDVMSGLLPRDPLSLALFEKPDGTDRSAGWYAANGAFAACLPRSQAPADQVFPGGGTYRFQFQRAGSQGLEIPLRVRALMKGAVAPAATGVLDLNLWLEAGTGVTAATAATDPGLQGVLASVNQILGQVGITLGSIDYYDYVLLPGVGDPVRQTNSVREVLATLPAGVKERLNLFCGAFAGGYAGRIGGCATARSNHSWATAGTLTQGVTQDYVIAHEIAHHLGLWHLGTGPALDAIPNGQPRNLMEVVPPLGLTLSPVQGRVMRAHPFVR